MPIDLTEYRTHVDLAAADVRVGDGRRPPARAVDRVRTDPVLHAVLDHHPRGADHVLAAVDADLQVGGRDGRDPADLLRVHLLHQIDVLWWGTEPAYPTSADVSSTPDLVDLDPLRARGRLAFRYRRQATTLPLRAVRSVERRVLPGRAPGAGLRYPRARPEIVALLDEVAGALTRIAPATVWLNSAVRSQAHQDHLRDLGYAALSPSSHCSGFAADITVRSPARRRADPAAAREAEEALDAVLRERQDAGRINVIRTGRVWHVCLSPAALPALRARFDQGIAVAPAGRI